MDIVQVAVIGVLGTLMAIQFKGGKSEYGMYIGVAVSLFIFLNIIGRLTVIIDTIQEICGGMNLNISYISAMVKMLGITYIAEFASGICKDAGYQTIAQQIEIFSKLAILALSMPILSALLTTIKTFLS